jgi:hypothetical protein
MTRFRKGTLDHDGTGKIGGSMKEADMTEPKKTAKKAEAETPADAAVAPRAARKQALEAEQARVAASKPKASAHTPQTGMESGPEVNAQQEEAARMFADADEKERQGLVDLQVERQVRGW